MDRTILGPREFTTDEVREQVVNHVHVMVRYWAGLDGSNVPSESTVEERLDGLAFSILAMLDGSNLTLPRFIVAPDPHPSDRQFHVDNNECWYPENVADVRGDISGSLHEKFARP